MREHPHSANAHDGLADGYEAAERWDDAAKAGSRAAELASEYGNPRRDEFKEIAARRVADAKAHASRNR